MVQLIYMKSEKNKFQKLLIGFYVLPIIHGLWGFYVILSGHWKNFSKFYESYSGWGFTDFGTFSQIFGILSISITALSIALIIIVFIKKLPKYNYIYPLYDISWTLILWVILPFVFFRYCAHAFPTEFLSCSLPLMDKAMIFDFLHPFVQIILPIIIIKKILK